MNLQQTVHDSTEEHLQEVRRQIDDLNAQAWAKRFSDPAAAAELALDAARLCSQGPRHSRGFGWSQLTLGAVAMTRGEYKDAREKMNKALELLAGCGDREGEAAALTTIGALHLAVGEHPAALKHHLAALEITRAIGNRLGEASALIGIGNVHSSLGDYATALEYHKLSLDAHREIGNRGGEASALNNIGIVYAALGEYIQALEYYQASLLIFKETGNRTFEANALTGLGNVNHYLGEYAEALKHYQASLEVQRAVGNKGGEGITLANIGAVYENLGDHSQALEHFQASLRIHRQIGNRKGEGIALTNVGLLHLMLGQHPQALENLLASLQIKQEIGHRNGEATVLNGIGILYHAMRDFPQALHYHQASLAIFQEVGDRPGEADALIGIGSAERETGEYVRALSTLEAAAAIANEIGSRSILAQALVGTGQTLAALGRSQEALGPLTSARALAEELGERSMELETSELLSREYEKLGNVREALAQLRRHLELKDEIFSEETRKTVHNLQTSWQIEVARKEAEIERLRNVELKLAFDELKSTQSQLVQSEKMASLGQLTAGIAHEINNPINFVSASIKPLLRDLKHVRSVIDELGSRLGEEAREEFFLENDVEETFEEMEQLASSIERGAARTTEIVTSLRSFSRLDEGGLKRVDLHDGLDAALTILSGSIDGRVEIRREYGTLPAVRCYPGEINQVFMNILTNAIKAIEGEGAVTIRTAPVEEGVMITIADTGVGMTPEVESHIFEPFYTTRDVGEGKGLGLSIAWGIVEKHGGRIDVTSTPGAGSEFVVTLPVG